MNKKIIYGLTIFLLIFVISIGFFLSLKNKSIKYQKGGPIENQNQSITKENDRVQTQSQTEEKFYTMTQVAQHNSKESCWSVIRGEVYDLTQWIDKHPGGSDKILALCGKDGTQAFENKHGGQEKPEKALKQFKIGKLKQ